MVFRKAGYTLLHSGHVIANHILVSFHAAFISSLLNIPSELYGPDVLKFVFTSYETVISAFFWLVGFHTGIAIHEMGHYLRAVKLNALKENLLPEAKKNAAKNFPGRFLWYVKMFFKIPYGRFRGVKKEGLTYYPEAPFNLSVAAAGPQISGRLALIMLPAALVLLIFGLTRHLDLIIYVGRLCLGIGAVGLLDFLLADPGKLKEFMKQEKIAQKRAQKIQSSEKQWIDRASKIKEKLRKERMQEITIPGGDILCAPWQFRNCGMGGRHTEKEYPESNISMQEMMFVPLCAQDYEEAQMITIELQTRLKQIIEKAEGARVMGIGLEGGLAPYITKESKDIIPEQRMWRMAVQAIKDIGYVPGEDVVIAFDPALSELSNAYRKEFKEEESIGNYYFWRGEEKVVASRDQLLELYKKAVEEIPIISIEDAFAEDDYEGWRRLMAELGDKIFIIGDDLVTTKDSTIEECADQKLINTALIKANQIGTLSETVLAVLVAFGKGLDIVVSHRSKSPNDDMEAQIALAANALGLKTGGGANTERLFKYGAVTKVMKDMIKLSRTAFKEEPRVELGDFIDKLVITEIIAYEEPTNAGIPTVGVEVYVGLKGSKRYRKLLRFTGATPLGTSAGVDEAIHLVDSIIEDSPLVARYKEMFVEQSDRTYRFKKEITEEDIKEKDDPDLTELWLKAQRYKGKGCKNAVDNVINIIAPEFIGRKMSELKSIADVDKKLLLLEGKAALMRKKISKDDSREKIIEVLQRKANLGMNAVLTVSLAIARLIAHVQGKDLWELLREEMKEVMAKTIIANGGAEVLTGIVDSASLGKMSSDGKLSWELLKTELSLSELVQGLQAVEKKLKQQGRKFYETLRTQISIYDVEIFK